MEIIMAEKPPECCYRCHNPIQTGQMTHRITNPKRVYHWECFREEARDHQDHETLQLQLVRVGR